MSDWRNPAPSATPSEELARTVLSESLGREVSWNELTRDDVLLERYRTVWGKIIDWSRNR